MQPEARLETPEAGLAAGSSVLGCSTDCVLICAVLYADGVSPQKPLAAGPDHRKVQVIYWTLCELGDDATYTEQAWFTLAAAKSELVQKLPGGMTHVFHCMLPLFLGAAGPNVNHAGMVLWLGEDPFMLYCDVAIHISDEPALVAALGAKGHAGVKPCPNVQKHNISRMV